VFLAADGTIQEVADTVGPLIGVDWSLPPDDYVRVR